MTTTMTTLTDFLLARIANEEDLARDAASEGTPPRTGWQLWTNKVSTTPGGERLGPRGSVEASPARVQAECEAKRAIVERCAHDMSRDEWPEIHDGSAYLDETVRYVLGHLALPYADHPDYRKEWRV